MGLLVLLSEEMMPRIQSSTCIFGNLMKDDLAATKAKKSKSSALLSFIVVFEECGWMNPNLEDQNSQLL